MTGRSRSARAAELEGFLIGITRRLDTERVEGVADGEAGRLALEARQAIAAGEWGRAEELLERAGARLDELRLEPRLREWPRDLIEYVPTGAPETAGSSEEDPLLNRLLLVQRLLSIRASQGRAVGDLVQRLRSAEAAIRRGDRERASRLVDEVHRALDAAAEPHARSTR